MNDNRTKRKSGLMLLPSCGFLLSVSESSMLLLQVHQFITETPVGLLQVLQLLRKHGHFNAAGVDWHDTGSSYN